MSKKLPLTPVEWELGKMIEPVAILDDDWYDLVSDFPWRSHHQRRNGKGVMYGGLMPSRGVRIEGVPQNIWLHRLIGGVPRGWKVRHRNGNHLDLRVENLQLLDEHRHETSWRGTAGRSGFIGVIWDRYYGLWRAEIRGLVVAYTWSEIEAARQYNLKIVDLFGDHAEINDLRFMRQ